ncbi:hypothetical protein [Streptomyces sp. GQFP]|uniref:hypothetical protein n=1 Tax=Streptomyces sp. GQFP TaxID=2907545 RepID=UPI001F33B3A4|nr:hypothetical protein [Streptomyces sp. GQFP]UIX31130.1 hypothetical protein LUX31_14400 [Streptomyces sp. GQFP]
MKRRSLPVAAALVASAALLLTACGGDDSESKDNDKIAGADTGSETSASPTASASASADSADRPKIELPSDLTYTFEWPKTGDADKDAVLADSEQSIKAVDLAIVNQDALDKAYLYYYEGEAAAGTETFVKKYVDAKASITGAYRFYDPDLKVDNDGTASLSYCEDQGKAYVKYLETNKVKKTEVTADSYVIYHTSLKRNSKGVWVIQDMVSEVGSAKCQP